MSIICYKNEELREFCKNLKSLKTDTYTISIGHFGLRGIPARRFVELLQRFGCRIVDTTQTKLSCPKEVFELICVVYELR